MIILYILLAIFVLLFMIMIHETGHYLAGKLLKFKIEEFSIGFGKPIFSKKLKSGEVFSLRWIPLGGFCAFHGEDDDAKEDDAECFNSYAPWKRLIVLFSGAFFNFISAVIFCLILLVSVGSGITQITNVVATNENKDLLKSGDIILEVEGVEPTFLNGSVSGLIANKKAGEDIVLKLDRNGEILDVTIQKYEEFKMENDSIVTDEEGNPVRDAIVWLDNRATEEAEIIEKEFGRKKVYEITGQPEVTATWPACKLLWVKRNEPEVWAKTKKIFLLEDYLLYKLTGKFITEKTLQSSTIYFDIKGDKWW